MGLSAFNRARERLAREREEKVREREEAGKAVKDEAPKEGGKVKGGARNGNRA